MQLYECGCNARCVSVDLPPSQLRDGAQADLADRSDRVFLVERSDEEGRFFTAQRTDPHDSIQICGQPAQRVLLGYLCSPKNSGPPRRCSTCSASDPAHGHVFVVIRSPLPPPVVARGPAVESGPPTRGAVVRGMAAGFTRCVRSAETALPPRPSEHQLELALSPYGEVREVAFSGGPRLPDSVAHCILERVKTAQFDVGGSDRVIVRFALEDRAP